jgi:hypothetical protein
MEKTQKEFFQKFTLLEKTVEETKTLMLNLGEKEKQQGETINQVGTAFRELCSELKGRVKNIFQQCQTLEQGEFAKFQAMAEKLKEFSESLNRERKALDVRIEKVENFLGQQDFSFEKVRDLINKSEETIQREVERELGLQSRKTLRPSLVKFHRKG